MLRSMHKLAFAALCASAFGSLAAFGCSSTGNVSLGKNGDDLGLVDCDKSACGPALGMPAITCSDGTIGGNTGRCVRTADGSTCGWEVRSCGDSGCKPPPPTVCPDGTVTVAGCSKDSSGGCVCASTGCTTPTCTDAVCGKNPYGMPNTKCADGSIGGPVCDASLGSCGWHIRTCPDGSDAGTCKPPPPVTCPDGTVVTGTCTPDGKGGCVCGMGTCSGTVDGGVTDGARDAGTCFDSGGVVPTSMKRCGTDADCTTGDHTINCCGSHVVTGVSKSEDARFISCEKSWDASLPGCGCPAAPTQTDDGKTIVDPTKVVVHCAGSGGGATGVCQTTLAP